MGRTSKLEECMICERLPCECAGVVQRRTRARAVKEVEAPVLQAPDPEARVGEDRPSVRDKMRAAAASAPVQPPPLASRPPVRARRSEIDLLFAAAVRNLEPILHPDERVRFASIITSEPTLDERQAFWKARHKELSE